MRLFRHARSFYPIHAQARELLRLYGGQMSADARLPLEKLVASKRSWHVRIMYALFGQVIRRRFVDALVVRALILADCY